MNNREAHIKRIIEEEVTRRKKLASKRILKAHVYKFLSNTIDINVSVFMKLLVGIRNKKEIEKICSYEMALLERAYPNLNTRHAYLRKYRNGIRKKYGKNDGKTCTHKALGYMKLNSKDMDTRNTNFEANLDIRTSDVATFDLREMVKKCRNAVTQRQEPLLVALGLMGLTGRRPIEILKIGTFEYVDKSTIQFYGQAKTKNSRDDDFSYEIPVLGDAQEIIEGLKYIREKLPLNDISNEAINSNHTRRLLNRSQTFFRGFFGTYKIKLNNKSFRSMYVSACYELNNMTNKMSFNAYAAKILGHGEFDKTTANSYSYIRVKKPKRDVNNYEFKDLL